MSDYEDDDETSGEDFSASEDEWKPEASKRKGTVVASSSSSDEDSDFVQSQNNRTRARPAPKRKNKVPVLSSTSRTTKKVSVGAKQKNDVTKHETKKIPASSKKPNISNKVPIKTQPKDDASYAETSGSSGDDYMVDPNQLDLGSTFFEPSTSGTKSLEETPPLFDCNAGLGQLSDSDDDMEDVSMETPNRHTKQPEHVSLNKNEMFILNLEKAKDHLVNFKSEHFGKDDGFDVGQLLAMGEAASTSTLPKKRKPESRKKIKAESGSDWEEVADKKPKITEDVVITVRPTIKQKKDRNQMELEAQIKRTLNRERKELQLMMHKVHILCWIGHGNHVNAVLNHPTLMQLCLAFMPSKYTYPKDRTDLSYFEQITKWYNNQMKLKDDRVHPALSRLPPLVISLALQIQSKAAICKKMYVLIFVVLIRAIGVQCRLIMNLVTLPLRPAQSELCHLSFKLENGVITIEDNKEKAKVKSEDSKVKSEARKKESSRPHKLITIKEEGKPKENTSPKKDSKSTISMPTRIGSRSKKPESSCTKPDSSSKRSDSKPEPRPKRSTRSGPYSKSPPKNPSSSKSSKDSKSSVTSPYFSSKTEHNIIGSSKPPSKNASSSKSSRSSETTTVTSPYFSPKSKPNISNSSSKSSKVSGATAKPSVSTKTGAETKKPVNQQVAKLKQEDRSRLDRRLLSTDDDDEELDTKPKKTAKMMDIWVEVYSEEEEQWMAVDLFKQKIHSVESIRNSLTKPISYVLAWNNDNSIKDVSSRYCPNWNTVTRKQRVEKAWLEQALLPYRETPTFRTRAEDLELNKIHLKEPLPKTIGEFKDHPLYALQRHLLKFQGIYPPDAPTLGFIRGEAIYARDCVYTMHSREIWVKSARVVKPGETAYKVVKARPKWDRNTNTCADPLPLEIFGYWQTQPYDPPTAENGMVPRNAYGNVELFLPEMLPKKTVHLQLPGLNRTCKKLNIDCANAVVGFDYHSGSCHPTYDGFVVCEEFAEQAMAQYWLDQEEAHRREEEKIKQRVYGNWKKLIKGLLIRERLQRKYNFAEPSDKPTSSKAAKKSRK